MTHHSCPALAVEERQPSTCGRSPLNVTVVSSVEGFRSLRREWDSLLRESRSDCVFLTWEWLFTWWKWYGRGSRLFILLLRDRTGRLRGIAPVMVKKTVGVFGALELIGSDSKVCSEYLDIIAERDWEESVVTSIMQFVSKTRSRWDVFVLSRVRADSPFFSLLRQLSAAHRLESRQEDRGTALFLTLPDTWEELLAGFGARTRSNMRYYRRRLEKAFRVQFEPWDSLWDRTQATNTMGKLQQKSISRKGLRGVFEDKSFKNFHAEIMDLFQKEGWLYITFLVCDGKPVAFLYAYLYDGTCYFYQTGFDTAYSSYSAGSVVHSYVLEDTIKRGAQTFEYLRGGQEYKRHFANSARGIVQLSIFSDGWRPALLRLLLSCGRLIRLKSSGLPGKRLAARIKTRILGA